MKALGRDLALVCESHHLNDLQDFGKYRLSQPYANSDDETANVLYAALLLRTADLLHMTKDRTPSILFKAIDPLDPTSQEEWAKQAAVQRVRPKLGEVDGVPDESAPKDTVEVFARFKNEKGFFGLTAFLLYVEDQLRRSYEVAELAQKKEGSKYEFPWRYLDDSQLRTEGFLRETYQFTFDQAKVLDLLTGHTLYNDTSVVLRELAQNAIDAVRFQSHKEERQGQDGDPEVCIVWDSNERLLSVQDNGVGMTQETIEKHFLRVGASLYQDEEFKKEYPDFNPISRFGIGILSTFMIADEVEVFTCSPEEDEARQLSLRSVHGRYLVRALDKETDTVAASLAPHGTLVRIRVRQSAELEDVLEIARRWIVVPRCKVTVSIDGGQPSVVGFASPADALRDQMESAGITDFLDKPPARGDETPGTLITEVSRNGVEIAYALRWSTIYGEWEFVRTRTVRQLPERLGTCLEGIRVEDSTPGFDAKPIWAIANVSGPRAPRTNVARSGIEAGESRFGALTEIYSIYCDHVTSELIRFEEEGFSTTWAGKEAEILLAPIARPALSRDEPVDHTDREAFIRALKRVPLFLIENGAERVALSGEELSKIESFWTTHSEFTRSAESMLAEARGQASLTSLLLALGMSKNDLPGEPLFCGLPNLDILRDVAFGEREIGRIRIRKEQRGLDLQWQKKKAEGKWLELPVQSELGRREQPYFLALVDIPLEGCNGVTAIRVSQGTYYLPNTAVWKYLSQLFQDGADDAASQAWRSGVIFVLEYLAGSRDAITEDILNETLNSLSELNAFRALPEFRIAIETLDRHEFLNVVNSQGIDIFDEAIWSRSRI